MTASQTVLNSGSSWSRTEEQATLLVLHQITGDLLSTQPYMSKGHGAALLTASFCDVVGKWQLGQTVSLTWDPPERWIEHMCGCIWVDRAAVALEFGPGPSSLPL